MSKQNKVPIQIAHMVRDSCLCLATQRAARALSRRFDDVFRPLGITSGQFSLLMALSRPAPWRIGDLAQMLVMDRTTITANLKPLERDGLIAIEVAAQDKRARQVSLTPAGRKLLARALPIWTKTHLEVDALLGRDPAPLRADLSALSRAHPGAHSVTSS